MTSRHTISHADELYVGNAYREGYSPDGRRGIKMTHLYAHEFLSTAAVPLVPYAATDEALLASYIYPSKMMPTEIGLSGNFLSLCTGVKITAGATIFVLDVPRNITWSICGGTKAETAALVVEGTDVYGQPMVEQMIGASSKVEVSGQKAFKSINNLHWAGVAKAYTPTMIIPTTHIAIGVGKRLGLPFHLEDQGKFLSLSYDGQVGVTETPTGGIILRVGLLYSTDSNSDPGSTALDVRGTVEPVAPKVPDASTHFTALMIVDHTTDRKAFGAPQASAATQIY